MSNFDGDIGDSGEDDADRVRAHIVSRYDRGVEGPIEPWEDASFIVYQVCDRYGFLHKNPLPHLERDDRMLELERERASKWIKMFENWDKYATGEKLKRRIFKGIPDSVRGEAWKKLLGVDRMMIERIGIYEKFKKIARECSPDIRQIDLDVNRTYRDHIMFRERFCVKQQALFHLLAAYSMYNVEVGYCQGMSGIAALLLMYMNEEDAFWAMSALLTDKIHHMHGFFIPGFPKLIRFQSHHDKILNKTMPKLQKHLEREGCHTSLYTLKWFMQCFLDRLPFSLVLRLYDIFMVEGDRILYAMAFGIMKIHKKQFLKMGLEELAPYLQETLPNDLVYSDDEMIDILQDAMNDLKKAKLDPPVPASKDEFPKIIPGSVIERGTSLTASKRAKMQARDRKNAIEVPIGRPESPPLNRGPSSPPSQGREQSDSQREHDRRQNHSASPGEKNFLAPDQNPAEGTRRLSDYDNTTENRDFKYPEQNSRENVTVGQEIVVNVTGKTLEKQKKSKSGGATFYVDSDQNTTAPSAVPPVENVITYNDEIPPQETRRTKRDARLELAYRRAQNNASVWVRNPDSANRETSPITINENSRERTHGEPSSVFHSSANNHQISSTSPVQDISQHHHHHRREPPPYRPRGSSNDPHMNEEHPPGSPDARSGHGGQERYRDPRQKQPPPYPGERHGDQFMEEDFVIDVDDITQVSTRNQHERLYDIETLI